MGKTLILEPVDNTVSAEFIDQSYEKGRSEYNRLYIPNEGISENGDILHYFPYGSISINNKVAIDEDHVFLKNGYLEKPGVIVEKYYISKKAGDVFVGDEKYFKVVSSNIDEVSAHNLVIVMAGQSQRFNLGLKEYFFVQEDKILIVLNNCGISAGPSNMLLKQFQPEVLGMTLDNPKKGLHDNITYYFDDALYNIVIKNEQHMVVARKDIKLYG